MIKTTLPTKMDVKGESRRRRRRRRRQDLGSDHLMKIQESRRDSKRASERASEEERQRHRKEKEKEESSKREKTYRGPFAPCGEKGLFGDDIFYSF